MIEPERWATICRPDVLEHEKRPGQVDVDDAAPDVVVELGQARVLRVDEVNVRGAVVEGVDAAEASDGLGDEVLHELGRGDVDLHAHGRAAVVGDRRGDGLGAVERDVGDDDRRALRGHRGRAGTSHPRAAADDERDLALQPAGPHRSSFASW